MEISIIIPAYNVEKYVEQCLDSLFDQTFQDFEIIVINDGSTDGTGQVLESYAAGRKDSRLHVIHQENAGQSVAKNKGMDLAQGNFYTFVDADDYVKPDYLRQLYDAIVSQQADISVCGFERVNDEGQILEHTSIESVAHYIRANGKICLFFTLSWAKLYRASYVKRYSIRFSEGVRLDDLDFSLKCNNLTEKIVTVDVCNYQYRYNPESITSVAYKGGMVKRFPYESFETMTRSVVSTEGVDVGRFQLALVKMLSWYGLMNIGDASLPEVKDYCAYCHRLLTENFPTKEKNLYFSREVLKQFPLTTAMGIRLFYRCHKSAAFPYLTWLILKVCGICK
ncbi:MAG: glycosyltransferase family 2 protein [Roseburia sp.]